MGTEIMVSEKDKEDAKKALLKKLAGKWVIVAYYPTDLLAAMALGRLQPDHPGRNLVVRSVSYGGNEYHFVVYKT